MKIFLIRHAQAIDYETETVKSDEYRFITPKGRETSINVYCVLKRELQKIEKIFTSPLIRAVQTAELLAAVISFKNDLEVVKELLPSSNVVKVLDLLRRNNNFNSVALIGHEPMMSILVEFFTGKNIIKFSFKKSGVCLIDFNLSNESGILKWFFNPKLMKKVE